MLTWLQQNTNCDIDSVLEKQAHDGEYANELFIRGTSLFLGIAIFYTKYINIFFHMFFAHGTSTIKSINGELHW